MWMNLQELICARLSYSLFLSKVSLFLVLNSKHPLSICSLVLFHWFPLLPLFSVRKRMECFAIARKDAIFCSFICNRCCSCFFTISFHVFCLFFYPCENSQPGHISKYTYPPYPISFVLAEYMTTSGSTWAICLNIKAVAPLSPHALHLFHLVQPWKTPQTFPGCISIVINRHWEDLQNAELRNFPWGPLIMYKTFNFQHNLSPKVKHYGCGCILPNCLWEGSNFIHYFLSSEEFEKESLYWKPFPTLHTYHPVHR